MKKELIRSLTATFEGHAQQTDGGVEYGLARDLQHLPGHAGRRNFNTTVIAKAKIAGELPGHAVADHFADVGKMVADGAGSVGRDATSGAYSNLNRAVELTPSIPYTLLYIRPMAVRPLDHPERWPTPWGFLFSEAGVAEGRLQ